MKPAQAFADTEYALTYNDRDKVIARLFTKWFNQFAALLLVISIAPVLVFIALLIWRRDGAPIIFGHYRVGYQGRLFRCYKFRTMFRNSSQMLAEILATDQAAKEEWQRDQKLTNDPRITPIGHFLRKTSLDEIPQLFNVIRGEMHLVGPRPVTAAELTRYGEVRWHYLSVYPGITGLWQVSGRNNTSYEERVELDREYVESRSFWMDASILTKTVNVVIKKDGAR